MSRGAELQRRAAGVIPGGMYGHMSMRTMPAGYPQFMASGEGVRMRDVDGREYLDLMCGWGPIVLGRRHPRVEAAVARQAEHGDCLNGPAPVMVELAELLVDTVASADWAMLAKNGTDATTVCVTVARAATGRRAVLVARGAYHGAAPWCTPGPSGVIDSDRAHLVPFDYNDVDSLRTAAASVAGDLAAVIVCPWRHDVRRAQELADPDFARAARGVCDATGAALILDDVRGGFRIDLAGSWEPLGVHPDLSAFSKAIANGHSLSAVTGVDGLRDAAAGIFTTGSFWYSPLAQAAAVACVSELRETDALARIERAGTRLRDGLEALLERRGVGARHTGPVQMPLLVFDDDEDWAVATRFADEAVRRGVYLHPTHNWFLSAAHTDRDVDEVLERLDDAITAL